MHKETRVSSDPVPEPPYRCGSPVIGKELSKQSHLNSDLVGTPGATRFSFFKDGIDRHSKHWTDESYKRQPQLTLWLWWCSQIRTYRVLQKKQPSTGNHRDTLLTPATPNFNVVIGSAEHPQQKWLFFLKAAKHKLQKTTLNWGTGGHDLCGVVLHGMAVFFEEPGLRKDTIGWTHGCRQTREWWRHCFRESIGISLGGCLCVGVSVCLRGRICANMGCAKWNTCSDSLDTFLTWFRNVVGCTGCRSAWQARHFESVTALSCTPAMQRTCNTHATHMQHTCNTTCNMSFLPVNLQSTCRIWRLQPQLRS